MTKPKTRVPGLGARIKKARKSAGLTQQAVADSLGIMLRSYQKYEEDASEPSLHYLISLSIVLGTTTDNLLGLSPEALSDE